MASILKVDAMQGVTAAGDITVTDGSVTFKMQDGLAKAFSVINLSSGNAIRKSLNLASITDIGTGTVESNFTNAFADEDYHELHMADASLGDYVLGCGASSAYSSTVKVRSYNVRRDNGSAVDEPKSGASIHGDLA